MVYMTVNARIVF